MDENTSNIITTIIELILKYGVPAIIDAIKAWEVDSNNISVDDINKLKEMIKDPSEYFKNE